MKREFKNPENPVVVRFSGGGGLLSSNNKGLGTTQHSQKEISNKQAFLSLRERLGEGSIKSIPIKQKRVAFTLAEVLITLGIIGIVAAMTLPALIASNKEKARVTNLKKIYSQIQNAWNMAIAENGDATNWDLAKTNTGTTNEDGASILDHSGREKFMSYILPYFKVTNDVTLNYEGDYSLDGRKTAEATSVKTDGSSASASIPMTIVTPDGFRLEMGWISEPNASGKIGAFWVTLPNERKKITGVTHFHFDIYTKKGFVPSGVTQSEFSTYCDVKNKTIDSVMNGRGCTAWVIYKGNMDYLYCNDLSWNGKSKCGK